MDGQPEYRILWGDSFAALEQAVNEVLGEGMALDYIGAPFAVGSFFYQAAEIYKAELDPNVYQVWQELEDWVEV